MPQEKEVAYLILQQSFQLPGHVSGYERSTHGHNYIFVCFIRSKRESVTSSFGTEPMIRIPTFKKPYL
jgi:hypothetical protein